MSELKFYFDESVELAVSEQLAAGGFDVVSAHSLDKLGDKDPNHLKRASEMGAFYVPMIQTSYSWQLNLLIIAVLYSRKRVNPQSVAGFEKSEHYMLDLLPKML